MKSRGKDKRSKIYSGNLKNHAKKTLSEAEEWKHYSWAVLKRKRKIIEPKKINFVSFNDISLVSNSVSSTQLSFQRYLTCCLSCDKLIFTRTISKLSRTWKIIQFVFNHSEVKMITKLSGILICFLSAVNGEVLKDSVTLTPPRKQIDLESSFNLKSDSSEGLCDVQVKYFQDSLEQNEIWARWMRDSWGAIPSGIYSGNLYDLGNFDQCVNLQHSSELYGDIVGQHCIMTVPFDREQDGNLAKISTPSRA